MKLSASRRKPPEKKGDERGEQAAEGDLARLSLPLSDGLPVVLLPREFAHAQDLRRRHAFRIGQGAVDHHHPP